MRPKTLRLIISGILVFLLALMAYNIPTKERNSLLATECPSSTALINPTTAILVGRVTNTGGDLNLEVWFEYGKSPGNLVQTLHQNISLPGTDLFSKLSGTTLAGGVFCAQVTNLDTCSTYYYRAVARNSGGIGYGELRSITTPCAPSVDLKVQNSDGPVRAQFGDTIYLSWRASNANSCTASGDWSGSKETYGREAIQLSEVKRYSFSLTCTNSTLISTDTVEVIVEAKPPTVITVPAVVTY